ncbi:MAG: LLM class flavin-dependent oxidoreductase [Gammaproteobacteria bacterium]|nr:LLM class flavin-dependent oxidoreductase [Gammaproteobacteria bacterium]
MVRMLSRLTSGYTLSMSTEFGIVMEASPGYTATLAREIEAMGYDTLLCPDTQNLSPDPFSQLALATQTTRTLRLGTGVTNPVTRDVAVTACAFSTLQVESRGRMICGIGRGDSSAAHIGVRNGTTAQLRTFVERLRAYTRGETIDREGTASRIRWYDSLPVTPLVIDVACTGPQTIRMAVDVGDRISFAVGSAPERIRWAMDVALARLAETGRSRDSIRIGAYVNLVCDPDERRAIALGRMISGMVAHFAGMKDAPLDHLPPQLKDLAAKMQTGYDMTRHAQEAGSHLAEVPDSFVDWFSICGPPTRCRDRLGELLAMGLDHVYQLGGSPVAHPHGARQEAMVRQAALYASDVMPHFR